MPQLSRLPRNAAASRYFALGAVLACSLATGIAKSAVIDLYPYAQYSWENDHNPFLVPGLNSGSVLATRPNVDDKVSTLVAGARLSHDGGNTNTYLSGEGRRVAYSTYDMFNHTEFNAALGHRRGVATGTHFGFELGASRQYSPYDTLAADTPVAYQRRHYGHVEGAVAIGSTNIVDLSYDRTYLRLPVGGAPDFNSVENRVQIGFGRQVSNSVRAGVRTYGLSGNYFDTGTLTGTGTTTTATYKQVTPELYLTYSRAGLLQLDTSIGYTHRTQDGGFDMKGVIGNAGLRYDLTAKTSVRAGVLRQVSGYYVAGGAQTTTSWSAGIDWHASDLFLLAFRGGYAHSWYNIPGLVANRTDDYDFGQATASWKATRWMTLSAYGLVQKRASTSVDYRFDASSIGMSVRLQRPER